MLHNDFIIRFVVLESRLESDTSGLDLKNVINNLLGLSWAGL